MGKDCRTELYFRIFDRIYVCDTFMCLGFVRRLINMDKSIVVLMFLFMLGVFINIYSKIIEMIAGVNFTSDVETWINVFVGTFGIVISLIVGLDDNNTL